MSGLFLVWLQTVLLSAPSVLQALGCVVLKVTMQYNVKSIERNDCMTFQFCRGDVVTSVISVRRAV